MPAFLSECEGTFILEPVASGLEDLGFSVTFPRNLDRQRSLVPIPHSKQADIGLLNGMNTNQKEFQMKAEGEIT